MSAPDPHDVTSILARASGGEPGAHDELLQRVYDELRQLAGKLMAREAPGATIQATVLVHDAWLRLVGDDTPDWNRRAHFFGAAAHAMRRILVEAARRRQAGKRGGDLDRVTFADIADDGIERDEQVLALHDALERFADVSPEIARVVDLRYFAGLSIDETAAALGKSPATVKREWTYARAWLRDRMDHSSAD